MTVVDARGRWTPAIAAAVVFGAVVAAATFGGRSDAEPQALPVDTAGATDSIPATSVPTAPSVVTVPTSKPVKKSKLQQTLTNGMAGDSVTKVQQRLTDLGFDPGPVDGYFGELTRKSVWAFEKLVMGTQRDQVTGAVTNEMWSRMQDPLAIVPRRPNATTTHMEIYLPEQVAIVFEDDRPILVTHISSGDEKEWCEEVTIQPGEWNNPGEEPIVRGECGKSITPGGVFEFYRRHEGNRIGSLGGMYNPVYFNYGIAVHGAQNVPTYPASHGCIRIPNYIAEYFPSLVENGDQVYVFDGKNEPEFYGAQLPVFNWIDPDYSTTTTSSTSSTTSTTEAPDDTDPPSATTTTKPPRATTTTSTTAVPVVTTTTVAPTTTTKPPKKTTTTTSAPPSDG